MVLQLTVKFKFCLVFRVFFVFCVLFAKTPEQQTAATAAAKLEEGDVKGAIRILCSDDKLAAVNTATLNCAASVLEVHNKVTLSGRYICAWNSKNC